MIIFGTSSKIISIEQIAEPCANCNTPNNVRISIWQKSMHIFWIPVWPLAKTGSSECMHCGEVLSLKKMDPAIKMSYDNIKLRTANPIWMYFGIGVIIIVVIMVNLLEFRKAEKVTQMIISLQKDDILQLKVEDNVYSLAKVSRVKGDSVFLFANKYRVDQTSAIKRLYSTGFETAEEAFTVNDLKEMDEKKLILDIERE